MKRYTHIQNHLWKQVYKEMPLFGYAIFTGELVKVVHINQTGAFTIKHMI